jgi:hypothetical protein
MKRIVAYVLTSLSLLLCLAVVVMWVRSCFKEDAVQVSKQSMMGLWHEEETWQAWSGWGGLSLCWGRNGGDLMTQKDADAVRARTQSDGRWHYHFVQWQWGPMYGDGSFSRGGRRTYLGFGFDSHNYLQQGPPPVVQQFVMLVVPWPALAAPLAVAPGLRAGRAWLRRRRLRRVGHCKTCGYDLRGNASGVCPECGAVAPRVKGDQ